MKNTATNTNTKTIGKFIEEHITKKSPSVSLTKYVYDYLNEKDCELFRALLLCIPTFKLTAKIGVNDYVVVDGYENKCYTSYNYDYPVACVYKDLLLKMSAYIKVCMKIVKEQYIKDKELRIPANDKATYNALREFANDYGIEITDGWDENILKCYVDIVGINNK